jgi:hypothetical protein
MSGELSELKVIDWKWSEVLNWALYYGFHEELVLSNIEKFQLRGFDLLHDISHKELGITIPLAIIMFETRIEELKVRAMNETSSNRSRKRENENQQTDLASSPVKRRQILEESTEEDELSEDEENHESCSGGDSDGDSAVEFIGVKSSVV